MAAKAIETRYGGCRFRSRLEARWAVFFDALGIEWEYEKEGYDLGEEGLYLPDFWLPKQSLWVEIKGQQPTDAEMKKLWALFMQSPGDVLCLVGNPGAEKVAGHWWTCVPDDGDSQAIVCELVLENCQRCSGIVLSCPHDWMKVFHCSPGCNYEKSRSDAIQKAARAANSARFEFGESG